MTPVLQQASARPGGPDRTNSNAGAGPLAARA